MAFTSNPKVDSKKTEKISNALDINLPGKRLRAEKLSFFEYLYFNTVQKLSVIAFEKLCDGKIENPEHITHLDSGFILASNHSSYFDWLVLYSVFKKRFNREIMFLAKEKLFKSMVWGKLVKAAKCIKVTDSGISPSSMKRIARLIKTKDIIGVFPEGTRSIDGELLPAKEGVVQIARMTKLPIIPVGLEGFYEIWPKDRRFPWFSKCRIIIGDPIYIGNTFEDENSLDYEKSLRTVMEAIGKLINKAYKY